MTRTIFCVLGAPLLALALGGCAVTSRSGELPPASAYAQGDWYDPWQGPERMYHGDDLRGVRRGR